MEGMRSAATADWNLWFGGVAALFAALQVLLGFIVYRVGRRQGELAAMAELRKQVADAEHRLNDVEPRVRDIARTLDDVSSISRTSDQLGRDNTRAIEEIFESNIAVIKATGVWLPHLLSFLDRNDEALGKFELYVNRKLRELEQDLRVTAISIPNARIRKNGIFYLEQNPPSLGRKERLERLLALGNLTDDDRLAICAIIEKIAREGEK